MNFSSHSKTGLWVAIVTAIASWVIWKDAQTTFFSGGLAYFGSLFPDLDTESIPSRWAARFGLAMSCCGLYNKVYVPAVIYAGLFFAIKSFPHRSWTHKYSVAVGCFGLGFYYSNFLYIAFGIGLICHYVLDSLSPLDSRNWL